MRRRKSILWKVTIWYSVFLCLLAVVVVGATFVISTSLVRKTSKETVVKQVQRAFEEIEYEEDDGLEIEEDLDFVKDGVYLSVYGRDGIRMAGAKPPEYARNETIEQKKVVTVVSEGVPWYVYKESRQIAGYGTITVLGVTAADSTGSGTVIIGRTLFVMLPGILIIAIFGGFLMTKRAFLPVKRIRQTAEEIAGGKDLTKRVNLGEGEDELHELGRTFDAMFCRLEEAFLREKQFTSDVSHELRTPISVILSQAEYAKRQDNCRETAEALEAISRQGSKVSKLIGQLLMLCRMEEGFEKIRAERLNVSELLEVTAEEMEEKAEEKGIRMECKIAPDLMLYGDETLLMRLFVNLLSNAVEYTEQGGWIKVSLYEQESHVVGMVEDNGIGIAEENVEKIWERFYQEDDSRTSNEEGSMGLGLSMVRWIVKAHHGTIEVRSQKGEGTCFVFVLPKVQDAFARTNLK